MSDNIQQIQASFNPLEDRILLKLHTGSQSLQAWMTRRYVKLLMPALQGLHPESNTPLFSEKKQNMLQMQHQHSQQNSNYQSPYEEPEEVITPLGDEPILLSKITFKGLETEKPQILLEPEKGSGLALSYQPSLLGALTQILNQALLKTDWALKIDAILEDSPTKTLQ